MRGSGAHPPDAALRAVRRRLFQVLCGRRWCSPSRTGLYASSWPHAQILRIAPFILRSYGISFLLLPLNIFSTYYFQALMKPGAAFFVSAARGLVLSGALILLLPALVAPNAPVVCHTGHRGRGGRSGRRADGALYARTGHQCGKGVRKPA